VFTKAQEQLPGFKPITWCTASTTAAL